MNNDNSFQGLMKSQPPYEQKGTHNFVRKLYVEMLLNETILILEKERLLKEIDIALDNYDEIAFQKLVKDLEQLNEKFGT